MYHILVECKEATQFESYGLRMLIFNPSATNDKLNNNTKGATKLPDAVNKLLQAVAIKDANMRLKLATLKLEAKCFWP